MGVVEECRWRRSGSRLLLLAVLTELGCAPSKGAEMLGQQEVSDCESTALDSEDPALLVHARIRCDAPVLPFRQLSIAPGHDGIYVAAPGPSVPWIVRVAEDASVDTLVEGVPLGLRGGNIHLALDPDGVPVAVGDAYSNTEGEFDTGLVSMRLRDDVWVPSVVLASDRIKDVLGHEFDPDGVQRIWFDGPPPENIREASFDGTDWVIEEIRGDTGTSTDYGLARDGSRVEFKISGSSMLLAQTMDFAEPLGTVDDRLDGYAIPPAVTFDSTATGPAFAVAWGYQGIRVGWPEDDTMVGVKIPGTEPLARTCNDLDFDPSNCPETCHETGRGVYPSAGDHSLFRSTYGIARTSDGGLWLAYLETINDEVYALTGTCEGPDGCRCERERIEDNSRSVLHVVEVGLDSTPTERLSMDLAGRAGAIDLRTTGRRLAIGLSEPIGEEPTLRVLLIDTEMLGT